MKKMIFFALICGSLVAAGCTKAKVHCFRCVDLYQVDPAFDVCSNDTSPSGRNAYAALIAGEHINNTNGKPDSCQGYDK